MRLLSGWARLLALPSSVLLLTGCNLAVLDGLTGGTDASTGGSDATDAALVEDVVHGMDAASDGGRDAFDASVDTFVEGRDGSAIDVSRSDASGDVDARDIAFADEASTLVDASNALDIAMDVATDVRTACACTADGYCFNGECAYRSCKAKLAAAPTSPSGVYWLDVDGDGDGGSAPFRAYCDMVAEGGGYTLALKVDGTQTTFLHDAALWENDATYRPEFPDLDASEAKLASYSSIGFSSVRIGMLQDGTTRWLTIPAGASSIRELMRVSFRATTLGRDAWKSLSSAGSLQLLCNREGFNLSAGPAKIRLGILANEQDSCGTSDSWIGFGGDLDGVGFACGNVAHGMPDNGEHDLPLFGYILVR